MAMEIKRGACLRSKTDVNDEPFVLDVTDVGAVHFIREDGMGGIMTIKDARDGYDVVDVLSEDDVQLVLERN